MHKHRVMWLLRTHPGRYIRYFIKWAIVAYLMGAAGGIVGGLFSRAISLATEFRGEYPWLLYTMPLGGILIIVCYQLCGESGNRGTNMVLEAVSAETRVTKATGPLIFISTVITHLVGGSAGREGAALQIGGWIGTLVGRWHVLQLDEKERKIAVMCGMSSVFAALFGTPVAAGVFCMEVFSVGTIYYAAMLPCFMGAFIGRDIARALGAEAEIFRIRKVPEMSVVTVQPVVILGICLAILSIFFIVALHGTEHKLKKWIPNPYLRIVTGSIIFILLTVLFDTRIYCGGSIPIIEDALRGDVAPEVFLMKILFTAIALGCGFKGGEIIPTLCVGAAFGCSLGRLLAFEPSLMAACGMIGLFAAVTNCPLSSILISMEMFGVEALPFFATVVSLSYSLSGYYSLYGSQKFTYSKTKNEYINRKSNE